MLKAEMDKSSGKAYITALGTAEEILVETAGLIAEITHSLMRPCTTEKEMTRCRAMVFGSLMAGVERGTDQRREELKQEEVSSDD